MFQEQLRKPQKPEQQSKPSTEQPFKWNRFQAAYDKKKQAQSHPQKIDLDLPIGRVTKISVQEPIPQGWRKMTMEEGKIYRDQLVQGLERWSIVGFEKGAIDGHGYGCNFRDECGAQCGEIFIVEPKEVQK